MYVCVCVLVCTCTCYVCVVCTCICVCSECVCSCVCVERWCVMYALEPLGMRVTRRGISVAVKGRNQQRGATLCSVCRRWFTSKGGLTVHRCRPGS